MGLEMASRRKRLAYREPNGKPQRGGERDYPPVMVKRLRDAAMAGLRDPEWGTELGRLFLEAAITPEMYAAGKKWCETVAWYHQAIGVKLMHSPVLERGRGGQEPDPDSEAGRIQAAKDTERAERFFEAHAVLLSTGAEQAVRNLCELNEGPCGMAQLIATRNGLSALANHWGLTERNKSNTRNVR